MTCALALMLLQLTIGGQQGSASPGSAPPAAVVEEETINGEKLSSLVAALGNKEFRDQRLHAMELIARYAKRPKEHIPSYLEGLKDPDELVRGASARNLGTLGNRIPSLVGEFLPQLSAALEDSQQRVRFAAAHALFEIGAAARSELPALRKHYENDKSPLVRQAALSAMVAVSEGSDDYSDMLLMAVHQDEFPIDAKWLRELVLAGAQSEQAVAALHKALRYEEDYAGPGGIRHTAAASLGHMGSAAQVAIPDLFEILKEPIQYRELDAPRVPGEPKRQIKATKEPTDFWLRLTAAWAITRIDAESTPKLFELLQQQFSAANPDLRLSSTIIACRLSPLASAKETAAQIAILTRDPDPNVRTIARLAELRFADPSSKSYEGLPLAELPLPHDHEPTSDTELRQARLRSRLDEIKNLCVLGDAVALARSIMLPTKFEKALIQGNLFSQMARDGKRKCESLTKSLEEIQHSNIQITDRLAFVPTAASSKPLRFYWFAGDWYLLDN